MGVTLEVPGAGFVSITLDGIVDGNDAAPGCCRGDCEATPIPPELGFTEELETATLGVIEDAAGALLELMLEAATEAAADRIAAPAMAAVLFAFDPA